MIAGRGKRVRQPTKYAGTIVKNGRSFTMHELFRMDDFAAESLTYTLVAEANAQYGNLGICDADQAAPICPLYLACMDRVK